MNDAARSAWLVRESGLTGSTRYVVRDVARVGRSPDNDVVLDDAYVSRRHCAVLVHAGDRCELHDVASKNGTYLNGQKICGPTRLKSGDEIRMCNKNLVFVSRVADTDVPCTLAE